MFGAKCWEKVPAGLGGSKLDPRSVKCRFLGYSTGRGNYKVQDVVTHRVFVSQDVIFEEGQPHRTSASVGETIPIFDMNTIQSNPEPPADTRPNPNGVNATHDNATHQNHCWKVFALLTKNRQTLCH